MRSCGNSMRRSVIFTFVFACGILILVYSFLLKENLILGLQISCRLSLDREAEAYLEQFEIDPSTPLPRTSAIKTYDDYADLPEEIRETFDRPALLVNEFSSYEGNDMGYVTHAVQRADGKAVYFVFDWDKSKVSKKNLRDFERHFIYAPILIGCITLGLMLLLAWFVLRRITRPVEELRTWTKELDIKDLERPARNFRYDELNEQAELVRKTLKRLAAGIEREKRFQKYAGHELRTPIAVLQTNLELLDRLGVLENERFRGPFSRMFKAVDNMRRLTTTLLWACREDNPPLNETRFRIDELITNILEENDHLSTGKNISVTTDLAEVTGNLPETVVRIFLSNIIRNALQHTWEGDINIRLNSEGTVQVSNYAGKTDDPGETECFGLGLQLITQLASRLDIPLFIRHDTDRFVVTLELPLDGVTNRPQE